MATQTLFCRLTMDDKSLQEVHDIILKKYTSFVVSEENEEDNRHFHVLIFHDDENKKNSRQNLQNFIKKEFELIGNSDYAITKTKTGTEDTLTKYVIKDGKYLSHNIDENKLKILQKQSYKKFKKDEFKIGLQKLRDNFIADLAMPITQHINEVLHYKCVLYNQDCNMNLIKNFVTTSYMKKYGTNDVAVRIHDQIFGI